MIRRKWVDVAVGAVTVLGLIIVALADTGARLPWALAGLGLLLVAYVAGRPGIGRERPARFIGFLILAIAAVVVMTAAEPSLATMQVIVYPLVWILGPSRRWGVAGSVAVGVAVLAGYTAGLGFTADVVREAALVAALSVAFSVAMGWWISAIAAYGDERSRLLTELTRAQEQVEALSRDAGAAHERERLAREIHDTLAQTLAGLVILAEQARRRAHSGDASAAASTLEHLEAVARDALDETRAIVARTAAVPGDQALEAAVERLVERFRIDTGLQIALTVEETGESLERDAQVVILRCLQEGLANVRKHAAAAHVTVAVDRDTEGGVRLTIRDDGRGFDTASPRLGYGLDGMTERVALAGGTVAVTSTAGAGTALTMTLPATARRIGSAT
ncbi:sensor histidine kinase [Microbacterium sp. NM3R9]|uniref:sensor histidine kinase n=1 Tax=Microbacterium thalli TaxID=3027921 RepID=UPI0023659D05|nr:sensor histidine kinase [Microbacterium thalli]MDD7929022.1 sensor histidine kinase [Microbacterium thalli]MDN8548180.1 sensor histidine kinase [Microbacterium thalli]